MNTEEWQELPRRAQPVRPAVSLGRNDPCWCGSGHKFKRCCLGKPMPDKLPHPIPSMVNELSAKDAALVLGVLRMRQRIRDSKT